MMPLAEMFDGEHEILHLSKRMRLDRDIYDREVAYLSDHQIFHRFAKNGDWGQGWSYWKLWHTIDEVHSIAAQKREKGWDVTYHPAYIQGIMEFIKAEKF